MKISSAAPARMVRRIVTGRLASGRWHRGQVGGRAESARSPGSGRYKVMVGPVGGPRFAASGGLRLHGHTFPVDGPHGTRGYIGEFGAPRVDGRTHEGFDITAACGTPLVAIRAGTILKTGLRPRALRQLRRAQGCRGAPHLQVLPPEETGRRRPGPEGQCRQEARLDRPDGKRRRNALSPPFRDPVKGPTARPASDSRFLGMVKQLGPATADHWK